MISTILKQTLPNEWKIKSLKSCIALSLILILILTSVIWVIHYRIKKRIIQETNIEQLEELDMFHYALRNRVSRVESHVINIVKDRQLQDFILNQDINHKTYIEEVFSEIMEYNTEELLPTFDQMRVLDLEGNEIIRVDLNNQKKAEIVPDLQNKSNRYYFKDMQKLLDCELYLSKIDLNVEYGKIEEPWNPVFRVGNSIINIDGNRVGYLIINVKFDDIIHEIKNLSFHPDDSWYLLDQNGYYLYHRNRENTYGFMFDNKLDIGFFNDHEKIWNDFNRTESRVHTSLDGMIYLKTFSFFRETKFNTNNTKEFHLVMHMPEEALNNRVILLRRGLMFGFILMLPILITLGCLLGISWTKNRYYISQLENKSNHDTLTNLLNKRGITEKLNVLTKLPNRLDETISLVFIDLNDLKKVNDTLGHDFGDLLIKSISIAIRQTIRDTDEAARIGGDEFIIVLVNNSQADINNFIERLRNNYIKNTNDYFDFIPTFSYGISHWNIVNDDINSFIKRADENMYIMKKNK